LFCSIQSHFCSESCPEAQIAPNQKKSWTPYDSSGRISVIANLLCSNETKESEQLRQCRDVGESSVENDSISLPYSLLSFPFIAELLFHKGVIGLGTHTPGVHLFKIRFSDNNGNIRLYMGSISAKLAFQKQWFIHRNIRVHNAESLL
jgi:hypothetical protein